MRINWKDLMEYCTEQNCETDYDGNVLYYVNLADFLNDETLSNEKYVASYSCEIFDDFIKEYRFFNLKTLLLEEKGNARFFKITEVKEI